MNNEILCVLIISLILGVLNAIMLYNSNFRRDEWLYYILSFVPGANIVVFICGVSFYLTVLEFRLKYDNFRFIKKERKEDSSESE